MDIDKLKDVVKLAEPFLMVQDYIPILQHFWFNPHHITAFNDIQAVQLEFHSDLHCAVPGKILSRLLSTITQKELDIEQAGDKLLVGSGKNQSKLPILPPDEFVFAFPTPTGIPVRVEQNLIPYVEKCLTTVSHDPTRPERNGVTFKLENDSLTLYTTDGKTITKFTTEGKFKVAATEELWVIVPTFFCEQLCRLINDFKAPATLYFDKDTAIAVIENNRIFTRLINANPPQYERAIAVSVPDINAIELEGIPTELDSALDRALLMIYPEKGITSSHIVMKNDGTMTIHTESDRGRAHDIVDVNVKADFELVIEPALLKRACSITQFMTIREKVCIFSNKERTFWHFISIKSA